MNVDTESERVKFGSIVSPLFVPGDRPELLPKALQSDADAIIIDLEDAVPNSSKEQARQVLQQEFRSVPTFVRINGLGTSWHEPDTAAVFAGGFAGLMVPKAENSSEFHQLCEASPIPVIALIESARGLSGTRQIASTRNVGWLAFGSIDFCADLACEHSRDALLSVRSELVLASRLAHLPSPIDGVTPSVDDVERVREDAHYARQLGFGAKLCIHPRQISAARAGFAPSCSEIEWAHSILSSTDGATKINGEMVDEPVRIRARRILSRVP